MFNDIITLYNYHKNANNEQKWYRTVIQNVQWDGEDNKEISADGKIFIVSMAYITIPVKSVIKPYLLAKQYLRSPDPIGYFTFNYVDNLDIVVKGEIDKEITDTYSITDLKRDYDYVRTLASLSDNTNKTYLKHWKVGVK